MLTLKEVCILRWMILLLKQGQFLEPPVHYFAQLKESCLYSRSSLYTCYQLSDCGMTGRGKTTMLGLRIEELPKKFKQMSF